MKPIATYLPLGVLRSGLVAALVALAVAAAPAGQSAAQEAAAATDVDRSATGGATTLEDILARQQSLKVDNGYRRENLGDPEAAKPITDQLGTLGGVSDADLWRAMRFNRAAASTLARGPATTVLIQDSGMSWLDFRAGTLRFWGGWLLAGMLGLLGLFYLLRGRIMIEGGRTGRTIERFSAVERFSHWLLAGSFVVLGVTGLTLLFGRVAIIPLIGREAFAPIAIAGKWAHNNLAWPFMLGLVMVTVLWIAHNLPNRHDLKWLALAGGLFSKGIHPPARKFNAGQKILFWLVLAFGVSMSVSGLALLFPFDLQMFGPTFAKLNALGLPQAVGLGELPTRLTPQAEMQLAQAWHAIVAFLFIAVILGHIYIGSVGMENAFDAMGSGQVDEQWAREHHGLWYDEVTGQAAHGASDAPPAE